MFESFCIPAPLLNDLLPQSGGNWPATPAPFASGHAAMVFKGGTSLSKAYGLIERFSEDIDVVTDVDFYLAHGAADPETAPSRIQQRERMAALDAVCANYVGGELLTELRRQFCSAARRD